MMSLEESLKIKIDYTDKFGESPTKYGMDLEAEQPYLKMGKEALEGKRGAITEEEYDYPSRVDI